MASHDNSSMAMENNSADADDSHRSALVPQTAFAGMPMAISTQQQTQDVIRGGMDKSSLFHSFRRRWLLAISMGIICGAAVGALLWYLFQETSSATAYFKVASTAPSVTGERLEDSASFDILRKTQMVMIQNPQVLVAALRDPEVSNLSIFNDVDNEVEFLRRELKVSFPQNGEILQIQLVGTAPKEELQTVVRAVSKAYREEVIFTGNTARLRPLDILRSSYRKLSKQVREKTESYYSLLKEQGKSAQETGRLDPESTILLTELRDLQKKIATSQATLLESGMTFQLMKQQLTDPAMLEQRISEAMAADPQIAQLQAMKSQYDMYAMNLRNTYKRGSSAEIKKYERMAADVGRQIAQYQQQMKAQLSGQQSSEPDPYLKMATQEWQLKQGVYLNQIKQATDRIEAIKEILTDKGQIDTDLAMIRSEIDGLSQIQNSLATRIEQWEVESGAPPRIVDANGGEVEIADKINTKQRYAITAIGALGTFLLSCFGISYLEFHKRKLNSTEQVDEGLGIRVLGALPAISGRKALNPKTPVMAQLTESIDSVRTALMHESTTRRRQIVMVTSAATMEGRTTVASQLAASLARAGRRTLLIDGDLRRPNLHMLFDLPLEEGLCEVLRAETDVTDVVRATHAEGLWLLTAGYCDADAVHALATDQVQPIFDKLRADYDFIIIDGAPVLGLSDSLLFGQHCDGAVLSVLRDYTSVPKIHQAAELLKSVGIRLIGSVVNGVTTKADRRVTHLQVAGTKSTQKKLEKAEA